MVPLNQGAYIVTEVQIAGYSGSFSVDCSGTINVGESKICTIINDDVPAKLTVIKNVINDNKGTAIPEDFIITVTGEMTLTSFSGKSG